MNRIKWIQSLIVLTAMVAGGFLARLVLSMLK